jgi:hypothetical protein
VLKKDKELQSFLNFSTKAILVITKAAGLNIFRFLHKIGNFYEYTASDSRDSMARLLVCLYTRT